MPESKPKSYRGYVTACKGSILLGGVKHAESSRFETTEQVNDWIHVTVKGNCEAHRQISAWGYSTEYKPPEIFASETGHASN